MTWGVYASVGEIVKKSLNDFMQELSENLITGLQPVLLTALTIYFMCKAWSLMYGRGDMHGQTMKDLTMQCIKMAFVICFFCNVPNFYEYVIDTLWNLDGYLSEIVSSSISLNGTSDIKTPFDAVDSVHKELLNNAATQMTIFMDGIFNYVNDVSVRRIVSGMVHAIVYGATLGGALLFLEACVTLSTFIGFVILITNTLGLAFIIAFGPLFGSFLLFPQLKSMFDSWLKSCLTFIMTNVFVTGGCLMMVSMSNKIFKKIGHPDLNALLVKGEDEAKAAASTLVSGPLSNALDIGLTVLILGVIMLLFGLFFLKCTAMASSLVGGLQMGIGKAANLTTPAMNGSSLGKTIQQAAAAPASIGGAIGKVAAAAGNKFANATKNVGRIIGALKSK